MSALAETLLPFPVRRMDFHEFMKLQEELHEASVEMWKAWAISKVDRDDEVARARYVSAVHRVAVLWQDFKERGMV